jgi:glutamate---cysteine ligase / carboxylate-amine ligase
VRTVGVEEELMLFGADRPAPAGEELADEPDTDVEHELKLEQAEIATEPATDTGQLLEDLRERRRELIEAAAGREVRVAALGTSPYAGEPTTTPNERYERMQRHFGLVAREQLSCGQHVHVSIGSRAEGVAAIDAMRGRLPVLVALAANSPFWNGADTGYASYRRISWGRFPTAGAPEPFGTPERYDRVVDDVIALGGALDAGMIYFDARLSAKYPTVEIRVSDVVQDVTDAVAIAALCRALVDTPAGEPVDGTVLRSAFWYAARFGLSGELCDVADRRLRPARDVVDRLLDDLGPALAATGDRELVERTFAARLAEGTGAELQRRAHSENGSAADVVAAAVARTAR